MKKKLATLMSIFAAMVSIAADPLAAEWRAVDEALGKKHSRSAVALLQKVEAKALELKRWPDYTAARLRRLHLDYSLAEDDVLKRHCSDGVLEKFAGEVEAAPVEVRAMLRLALMPYYAELAFDDCSDERFRTKIVGEVVTNLPPWSAQRVGPSLTKLFAQVMADAPVLQAAKTADWSRLYAVPMYAWNNRKISDTLARSGGSLGIEAVPTLYDFALECCAQLLETLVQHDELVNRDAQGRPMGLAVEVFARLDERLRFHANDFNRTPFAYAKLTRINFEEKVMGSINCEQAALELAALAEEFQETSWVSALAAASRAYILEYGEGVDMAALQDYCRRFAAKWPNTPGGDECRENVQSWERPDLSLFVERTWCRPSPSIFIEYRNLSGITFRLVRLTVHDLARHHQFDDRLSDIQEKFGEYIRRPAAKTWSVTLKPADKLRRFQQVMTVPSDIPKGHYLLLATGDNPASTAGKTAAPARARLITVTDLAFVTARVFDGFSGYVLDAEKGTPIAGAEVGFWRSAENELTCKTTVKTGADGSFFIPESEERGYLRAVKGMDEVISPLNFRSELLQAEPTSLEHIGLMTDRDFYRPGQTVKFKGIAFYANPENNQFHVITNRRVSVSLSDPDGKEVGKVALVSNALGSFSGEFAIPRNRLTGGYAMVAKFGDKDPQAEADERIEVEVEEYQRPKFTATIRPVKDAKFGVETRVTGFAKTFTGLPVPNAKVEWRVLRSIYSGDSYSAESVTIAQGTVQTDENGEFSFVFTPTATRPEKSKDDLVFVFDLLAEVTDSTGETHETQACDFRIADMPWESSIDFQSEEGWITQTTPTKLAVSLRTCNDEPVAHARGTIEIFALKGPGRVVRAPAPTPSSWCSWEGSEEKLWDVTQWPTDRRVAVFEVITDAKGKLVVETGTLPVGVYQALYKSIAPNGKEVRDTLTWHVIDPQAKTYAIREPNYVRLERSKVKIGETARLFWGSGYDDVWCRVIVRHGRRKLLDEVRTNNAFCVELPVTADLGGTLSFETICVRENRLLHEQEDVQVLRPDRGLKIECAHLTSKLKPGAEETWTLTVRGAETNDVRSGVELLALLYDRSLDELVGGLSHWWYSPFASYEYLLTPKIGWGFANSLGRFGYWEMGDHWSSAPCNQWDGFSFWRKNPVAYLMLPIGEPFVDRLCESGDFGNASGKTLHKVGNEIGVSFSCNAGVASDNGRGCPVSSRTVVKGEPPPVTARRNLNEVAFFLPHLITDANGTATFSFKVPEALTGWKFMVFAHDPQLREGEFINETIVTTKPLMVEPIAPRFVREGDRLAFPVKVTNRENVPQSGTATLDFFDAATGKPCLLGVGATSQAFTLGPCETKTVMFELAIPDGCRDLRYVAAAKGENFSDGEEGRLPVISKRLLVRASLPIRINRAGTKKATFKELVASAASSTLKHTDLTVHVVSDPAWHAFLALPSLKESPHESMDQVFSRFYANVVAQHLVQSRPGFRAAAKRAFGELFESGRLVEELQRDLARLEGGVQFSDKRGSNGNGCLWPWHRRGPNDICVTMYILTGYARLLQLVGNQDWLPKLKAIESVQAGLDATMSFQVKVRKAESERHKTEYILDPLELRWLYLQSFTGATSEHTPFLLDRLRRTWTQLDLAGTAMAAIVLTRQSEKKGDWKLARTMLQSLKERAVRSEEFGLYWKCPRGFNGMFLTSPVSDQALAMEAFLEVAPDDVKSYDAACQWLLEQKRTQKWPTTVSTADAIYAILRGVEPLSSEPTKDNEVVTVALGGGEIPWKADDAGTGFYEYRVPPEKIAAKLGEVAVSRKTDALGWVSVNWTYQEDATKVRAFEQSGLRVAKTYYKKTRQDGKECLVALNGGEVLEPGDELVARLVLDSNRLYEYVHLRDERPATAEPVDLLSGYRWQGGIGFYQATGDMATNYYIDQLPQGRFVLETSFRVRQRGVFTSGLASVQCLYAPEFGAHSAASVLTVVAPKK